MKLEDQVVYLELSKSLKELGVKQESLFYWIPPDNETRKRWYLQDAGRYADYHALENCVSAFTVAELGEILPSEIQGKYTVISYRGSSGFYFADAVDFLRNSYGSINDLNIRESTEANARAKMLIHLIKKGTVSL